MRGAEYRGPLALRVLAILKASSEAIEPGGAGGKGQINRCQIKQGDEVILATRPPPPLLAVNSSAGAAAFPSAPSSPYPVASLRQTNPGLQEAKRRRACAERTDMCNPNVS